jgi:hypothetical protein
MRQCLIVSLPVLPPGSLSGYDASHLAGLGWFCCGTMWYMSHAARPRARNVPALRANPRSMLSTHVALTLTFRRLLWVQVCKQELSPDCSAVSDDFGYVSHELFIGQQPLHERSCKVNHDLETTGIHTVTTRVSHPISRQYICQPTESVASR